MQSLHAHVLTLSFMLVAVTSTSAQTVLRVDASAPAGGDGTSWPTAFNHLQDALEAAKTIAGPEKPVEIRVAAGTYMPDGGRILVDGAHIPGSGDRDATFQLINHVRTIGGFPTASGGEVVNDREPDPEHNKTILSGDLAGDDGPDFANNDENCYTVLSGNNIDNPVILDGFTITGGNEDGGMSLRVVNLTVNNCTFVGNVADGSGGGFSQCCQNGGVTFTDCAFIENKAGLNGGGALASHETTFTNCTFSDNVAGRDGGAIYGSGLNLSSCTFNRNFADQEGGALFTGDDAIVTKSTFLHNTASRGGGMFVYSLSNPIVTECTFIENTSEIGGGMHSSSYTEPTVTDCTFVRNTSIIGGGMYNRENEPSVARCTFIGNRAQNGGGMYNWDVRLFTPLFRTAVSHCVFVGNVADSGDGGAMFNRNSLFSVTNCAFVGNMAIETDDPFSTGSGGGIFNFDTFNRIHNCTFFGNVAERDGGGFGSVLFAVAEVRNTILWSNIADANGDTGGPFHGEAAQITGSLGAQLFNSCIKDDDPDDSSVPFGGAANGNIDDDPFLRRLPNPGPDGVFGTDDDDLGDLRLRPGSPCINRGDNALLPPDVLDLDGDGDFDEPIPFDLGGLPRVFLEIVDMGAYEFTIEIPEVCHVESGHENDCNDNGVEDHCEFEIGFGRDCNRNGVLDACELADGRLVDGDGNGTPDACEPPRGEIGEGLAAMNDSAAFITPMSADRACSEFPVEMSTAVELIGYDISSAGAEAPTTVSLVPQGPAGQYLVELDRPIPQRQWTSITLTVRNNMGVVDVCLHVAHLPCDSNLDGEVGLADVSAFVGQVRDGAHLMLADINGDGDTGLSDTSAWVNNFNGNAAIGIPRANGTSLPAKPNCP